MASFLGSIYIFQLNSFSMLFGFPSEFAFIFRFPRKTKGEVLLTFFQFVFLFPRENLEKCFNLYDKSGKKWNCFPWSVTTLIFHCLAEDTLWTGIPGNYTNPDAPKTLSVVRKLVDNGQYAKATEAAVKLSDSPSDVQSSLSLFKFHTLDVLPWETKYCSIPMKFAPN